MNLKSIRSDEAPAPAGHYSQAVIHAGVAYVSAQLPKTRDGDIPTGVEAQTELVLQNVEAVLRAAGAGLSDLIRVTVYLARIEDWSAMNDAYQRVLGEHRPARSVVAVGALKPGVLVSVDALAAVDG